MKTSLIALATFGATVAALPSASVSPDAQSVLAREDARSEQRSSQPEHSLDDDPDFISTQFGKFPNPNDPFHFVQCPWFGMPQLPPLDCGFEDDTCNPKKYWIQEVKGLQESESDDSYAEYWDGTLCGWLDMPLDYTNASDPRVIRVAVAKFQVADPEDISDGVDFFKVTQSERTVLVNPGGPGASGVNQIFAGGGAIFSMLLSKGRFDVLAWDPRGVGSTLPGISCFPYNADGDRWSMSTRQSRMAAQDPEMQLEVMDAMNNATMRACWERYGDIPRFLTTAFVARDLDMLREALGEDELTAHMFSYGTSILQVYANMFPDRVGRLVLDGPTYQGNDLEFGASASAPLTNSTDSWEDGFLGECLNAGPNHCPLASEVGKADLQERLQPIYDSLALRPIPATTRSGGPELITYTTLNHISLVAMYNPGNWPRLAMILSELEQGNIDTVARYLVPEWEYDPSIGVPENFSRLNTDELMQMVICSDTFDAPQPESLQGWGQL